jgi:anti-anti-sigma factor
MLLEIQERKIDPDITVLELAGKLALGRESQRIETVVDQLVQQGRLKTVLDLTRVDYIDSAGIGLLALAAGKLKEAGGKLAVVAAPEGRVLHMLRMTQMTAIVTVAPTLAEAVAAVGGQQRASA